MLAWLKKQSWVITLGMILSAVLLALAGSRSVKRSNRAEKNELAAVNLMNTGIASDITKAKAMSKKADRDKVVAAKAKTTMQDRLEKLGEANEGIDAVVDRFNSKRLRGTG